MTRLPDKTPDRIAGMFDAIAPRYDLLNHLLSAGIDRRWRKRAIASLGLTGRETLIDVCTGTADVALEATSAARIVGVDFAGAMLVLGFPRAIGSPMRQPWHSAFAMCNGPRSRVRRWRVCCGPVDDSRFSSSVFRAFPE
jgi:demethylmenaquinone methyltransferase/2-methoxy-6-polyprenyl-1,4-benzoquinol methylase